MSKYQSEPNVCQTCGRKMPLIPMSRRPMLTWGTFGISVLVAFWAILKTVDGMYSSNISSLNQTVESYSGLVKMWEELKEPRLLFEDRISRVGDRVWMHAGNVQLYPFPHKWENGSLKPEGKEYICEPPEGATIVYLHAQGLPDGVLRLHPGERYEYEIGDKSYYLEVDVLNLESQTALVRFFELNPIYQPPES